MTDLFLSQKGRERMFNTGNSLSVISKMTYQSLHHETNRLRNCSWGTLFFINNVMHRQDFDTQKERDGFIKKIQKHNKYSDDLRAIPSTAGDRCVPELHCTWEKYSLATSEHPKDSISLSSVALLMKSAGLKH